MGRFMGRRRKNTRARPSLADADGHVIAPVFPFTSSTPNHVQLPITLEELSATPTSSNRKKNAFVDVTARSSITSDEALKVSFLKKSTRNQLATIPEHSALISQDAPPDEKKYSGFGFSFSNFSSDEEPATQKRHGYGIDYSDFSEDSDNKGGGGDAEWELHSTSRNIITPSTSFQDILVVRDIRRSFSYTAPSTLKCTHAKLE
jgi:hypothetical protein